MKNYSDDPSIKLEDVVHVGDEIETYVMRVNDQDGIVTLSKKRLDSVKNWETIEEGTGRTTTVLEGVVTEENKGGVVVMIKGIRVFVPASQTGLRRNEPMTELVRHHRSPAHHRSEPSTPPRGRFHPLRPE